MHGSMQRYTEVYRVQGGVQRCIEVHRGAWRYGEGCMEVHRGTERGVWRCAKVCGGAHRCFDWII